MPSTSGLSFLCLNQKVLSRCHLLRSAVSMPGVLIIWAGGEVVVHKSFRFVVEKENGDKAYLKPGRLRLNRRSAAYREQSVLSSSPEL